jgi:hypothetical protein
MTLVSRCTALVIQTRSSAARFQEMLKKDAASGIKSWLGAFYGLRADARGHADNGKRRATIFDRSAA